MQGRSRPSRSQSSRVKGVSIRPAMARRCTTALVEPPTAPITFTAFSNASRVRIFEGVRSSCTISTIRRPDIWASVARRASGPGRAALPGRVRPSASTMVAMVEAVPMVLQCPAERLLAASASRNSDRGRVPARTSSDRRQTSVPLPSVLP